MTASTHTERVVFEVAGHRLTGRVVDTTTRASYTQSVEIIYTVDADGSRYTVPEAHTRPA